MKHEVETKHCLDDNKQNKLNVDFKVDIIASTVSEQLMKVISTIEYRPHSTDSEKQGLSMICIPPT